METKTMREIDAFRQRYIDATDPNITARTGVKVLCYYDDRPVVRTSSPGCHFLTCRDSLGCYVFVPCDDRGITLPPRYED